MATSLHRIDSDEIWIMGDVHGRVDRAARLLENLGMVDGVPAGSTLVQLGDLIDCGRKDGLLADRIEAAELPPNPADVQGPSGRAKTVRLQDVLRSSCLWPPELMIKEQIGLLGALDSLNTIRWFQHLQKVSVGPVIVLLGNHEIDLLRGRSLYFRRQKAYLLALLGIEPETSKIHLDQGLPLRDLAALAPELEWVAGLPILVSWKNVVAVHGGPTYDLLDAIAQKGVADADGLGRLLDSERCNLGSSRLLAEGTSLVAPDMPRDDFVFDGSLRRRFLELMGVDTIVVGHSAFIHERKGEMVDEDDASSSLPMALAGGAVIKADTNVKRGAMMWLLHATEEKNWRAFSESGLIFDLAMGSHPGR